MDGGMNRCEFLQTSHPPEALHRPLASSKRQVRVFSPVVEPTPGFLPDGIADNLHRGTVGAEFISHNDLRLSVAFH